ncbi:MULTISPECIES: hypothetical protein [Pseudomonas]|uniref:Uncharacterized protein n=2 Tax=Pseudomonas TaxID=286 RepID=A0A109LAT3_PSEFL|nr:MULTISPECIES: hypothetical protein [Pseudomonas]KRC97703.1 hypothetical protein ASE33_03980 [Pseudomonas sp. Root9]KWV84158.1 hypothetical protein PFL603g_00256 [Pseudomonas fluorescens]MDD1947758.1 hypothetical protein [Pseudomonas carnis]
MIDPRRIFFIEIALSMLEQWYSTWEGFKEHRDGTIRRLALHSKARGLVYHDRCLLKAEGALND